MAFQKLNQDMEDSLQARIIAAFTFLIKQFSWVFTNNFLYSSFLKI